MTGIKTLVDMYVTDARVVFEQFIPLAYKNVLGTVFKRCNEKHNIT